MKITIVTLGSLGDLLPFVAIGRTLKERGHTVRLFGSEPFLKYVEEGGIEFVQNMTRAEYERGIGLVADTNQLRAIKGFRTGLEERIEPIFENVRSEVAAGSDLVISPPWAFGARIAQELEDFPLATVHLAPMSLRSTFDVPPRPSWMPRVFSKLLHSGADGIIDGTIGKVVNRFRKQHGLPKAKGIMRDWWNSPQFLAGMFPDWFAPPRDDWPAHTQLFDFACYDGAENPTLPEGMQAFLDAGESPIVFTQPSYMSRAETFYERSVEVAGRLGRRAMLLTPHEQQVPGTLPEGVRHFPYAPYRALLPHVAALVHHGGVGTVAQALAAGCPQLIVPLNFDQPDNASRVEALGVGRRIRSAFYTVNRAVDALGALIDQPVVTQKSQEYADRCQPETALNALGAAMEQFCGKPPAARETGA